jgi:hypothetical protein
MSCRTVVAITLALGLSSCDQQSPPPTGQAPPLASQVTSQGHIRVTNRGTVNGHDCMVETGYSGMFWRHYHAELPADKTADFDLRDFRIGRYNGGRIVAETDPQAKPFDVGFWEAASDLFRVTDIKCSNWSVVSQF